MPLFQEEIGQIRVDLLLLNYEKHSKEDAMGWKKVNYIVFFSSSPLTYFRRCDTYPIPGYKAELMQQHKHPWKEKREHIQ